jgi:hypothetical protein
MAKLLIQTQVFENYGAHAWNGEGDCPQYWKAKGGEDYVLPNFTDFTNTKGVVDALRSQVEADDHYWRETVVSWSVIGDEELTQWEKDQLEFEGKITSPTKVLSL